MKYFDKSFIKKNIGNVLQISTRESDKLGLAYYGVLKDFKDNKIVLDPNFHIDYKEIYDIIIMDIN
jgi:hypothetical protein